MNPFEYVNTINSVKKPNMMRDSENDTLAEKEYNAYIVNKALSNFPDTILHANLMNINHHLSNRAQYEFFLNSVRPKKRFAKWAKDEHNEDLEIICGFYQCNKTRAREYLSLLNMEQLDIMKKQLETGGVKNESGRKPSRDRAS